MNKALSYKDTLHCEGKFICNTLGEKVFLRGTNLGGWLIQEEWMGAFTGADSQWEMLSVLENRFGKEKTNHIIKTYEDNFITEYDLDYLAKLGFTCLRVPFWYRNFLSDDMGTPIYNANGQLDFQRLDYIVELCAKRGMYVIIDMHGVPGFQSIAHHSGRTNHCELYNDNKESLLYKNIACKLWGDIAEHFKDNPAIAAFDLMNEPMCDYKGKQKVNKKYWDIYNLFYNAIRKKDPKRIITVEAIWTPMDIPKPSYYGWENIIYQYHLYMPSNKAYSAFVYLEKSKAFNNPVLIGEFSPCRGKASWDKILNIFNKAGYNWLTWTYKGFCKYSPSSEWFMIGKSNDDCKVDLKNDSYEDILRKWSCPIRSENNWIRMNNHDILSQYASKA